MADEDQTIWEETKKVNKQPSTNTVLGIIAVIAGISIVGALYLFPVVTILGTPFTIVQIKSYCSNSLVSAIFRAQCGQLSLFFYLGWLVSGIFIIAGIYTMYSSLKKNS